MSKRTQKHLQLVNAAEQCESREEAQKILDKFRKSQVKLHLKQPKEVTVRMKTL